MGEHLDHKHSQGLAGTLDLVLNNMEWHKTAGYFYSLAEVISSLQEISKDTSGLLNWIRWHSA